MYFPNYGLRKACLDKCLKTPISEDPSTRGPFDIVNGPKHCAKLNERQQLYHIDSSI